MKILHVDSSILSDASVSRQLTAEIINSFKSKDATAAVTYLDLGAEPVGHLTGAHLGAAHGAPVPASLEADIAAGRKALDDFMTADVVVIGAPMYNFTIPSQLKAWLDRLAVANVTFRYTDKGAVGLAGGKKLVVASSRGGVFGPGSPIAAAVRSVSAHTATELPSGNGHHRLGSSNARSNPCRRSSNSDTTSGCSSPTR